MKIKKTEVIAGIILWAFIVSGLYLSSASEKHVQQQIEDSINSDTVIG